MTNAAKNTLLVRVGGEAHALILETVTRIADKVVLIEPHKTLNQTRGVVKSQALSQSNIEELRERLTDQGIT